MNFTRLTLHIGRGTGQWGCKLKKEAPIIATQFVARLFASKREKKAAGHIKQDCLAKSFMAPVDSHGTMRLCLDSLKLEFQQSIDHLKDDLSHFRTGRVSSAYLEGIDATVDNKLIPVLRFGAVTNRDAQTLAMHLENPLSSKAVVSAIQASGRNFTVSTEPGRVVVQMQKLTQESREQMVKSALGAAEACRRAVRSIRNAAVAEAAATISAQDARRATEELVHKEYLSVLEEINALLARKRNDLLAS